MLIVTQHYAPEVTGNAPYAAGLASGLAKHMDVHVVTTFPHYPQWSFGVSRPPRRATETIDGVVVTRLRHYVPPVHSLVKRAFSELSFGVRVLFLPVPKADAVLMLTPGLISSAVAALRFRGRKRIVWVQDLYARGVEETGAGGSVVASLLRRVESGLLSSSAQVWVIHRRFADYIAANLGVSRQDLHEIRNWTHISVPAEHDRNGTRASLGWPVSGVVALHAGNQGAKQGLENVVEAAKLADATGIDVTFVLLGGGNQHERLRAMGKGVRSLKFIDALPDGVYEQALLAADVLLVNEAVGVKEMSVPSKLTSYFASGVPVVAAVSADGATADELKAGGGLRVDSGAPRDLLDAVVRMVSESDLSKHAATSAREFARSNLSQAAAIDRAIALLSLLERAPDARTNQVHSATSLGES